MTRINLETIGHDRQSAISQFIMGKTYLRRLLGAFYVFWHERKLRDTARLTEIFSTSSKSPFLSTNFKNSVLASAFANEQIPSLVDAYYTARGYMSWESATKTNNASHTLHHMQRRLEIVRKICNRRQKELSNTYDDHSLYDARLNRLTPGLDLQTIHTLSHDILSVKDQLQNTPNQQDVSQMIERKTFAMDANQQEAVLKRVCAAFGYNEDRIELTGDERYHPYCFIENERMIIPYKPHANDFVQTVLDVVHEMGHGLLRTEAHDEARQSFGGLHDAHYNGPDEACAMFMEQYVARTPEFAQLLQTIVLQETGRDIDPNHLAIRLTNDTGSLNRASAHPNRAVLFHLAYTQLEAEMIDGELNTDQLEERWKDVMHEFLGREPNGSAKESFFQDPHWVAGEFGRFPAGYFMGHLIGAQLYETMLNQSPDILCSLSRGCGERVVEWFKDRVASKDRMDHYNSFMLATTERELSAQPFLDLALKNTQHTHTHPKNTGPQPT